MKTFYNEENKIITTFSSEEEKETIFKLIQMHIMYRPKAHRKARPNFAFIEELTNHGSGFSASICNALGVDPYGYKWVKKIEEIQEND